MAAAARAALATDLPAPGAAPSIAPPPSAAGDASHHPLPPPGAPDGDSSRCTAAHDGGGGGGGNAYAAGNFLAFKAGMVGVDKAHVARVVEEASKGSKYYANAQAREAALAVRVAALREAVDRTASAALAGLHDGMRAYASRVEASRNLTRVCVCLDMDQFFCAVEARDDPSLVGKPFVVGGMGMISAASYESRKYGVRSAMPGFIAVKLCPSLVFVPPNFAKYEAAAAATRAVFARYDADFRAGSLDEAFLDITAHCEAAGVLPPVTAAPPADRASPTARAAGCGRIPTPHDARAIADVVAALRADVKAATGGLTASCGIAPNPMLAKICSNDNKPDGQAMVPWSRDAIVAYLAPLPVRRLPGVGKVMEATLTALGVATCADILAQLGRLRAAFNERTTQWLARLALGIADAEAYGWGTPVEDGDGGGGVGRKSLSHERTFADCGDAATLRARCRDLAHAVAAELCSEGLLARTVTLKLKLHTFEVRQKGASLPRATNDAAAIAAQADALLATELPIKLRLMGVRASALSKASAAPTLLDRFVGGSGAAADDDDSDVEVVAAASDDATRADAARGATPGAGGAAGALGCESGATRGVRPLPPSRPPKRPRRMHDFFGAAGASYTPAAPSPAHVIDLDASDASATQHSTRGGGGGVGGGGGGGDSGGGGGIGDGGGSWHDSSDSDSDSDGDVLLLMCSDVAAAPRAPDAVVDMTASQSQPTN